MSSLEEVGVVKRSTCLLALALLSVIALIAGAPVGAKTRATVTLTFTAVSVNKSSWDVIIPNFERAYPDIHVEPSYVPFQTIGALLRTAFQAGNAPDVLTTAGGSQQLFSVLPFAKAGWLTPLLNAKWAKRLPLEIKRVISTQRGSKGNYLYAAPLNIVILGPLYNRDLF